MNEDEEALFLLTHNEVKVYIKEKLVAEYWTRNGIRDGEYKMYYADTGQLHLHVWFKWDVEVADFIKNPELKKEYGIE